MSNDKIEINKKMVGKTVRVISNGSDYLATVKSVKDEETFIVTDLRVGDVEVSIFDIRGV